MLPALRSSGLKSLVPSFEFQGFNLLDTSPKLVFGVDDCLLRFLYSSSFCVQRYRDLTDFQKRRILKLTRKISLTANYSIYSALRLSRLVFDRVLRRAN